MISIHAPARGATQDPHRQRPGHMISIHAPARGATNNHKFFKEAEQYFNPRSREGSDWHAHAEIWRRTNISIHAPARGATGQPLEGDAVCLISIHAPARGATHELSVCLVGHFLFQSTLPRGERPMPPSQPRRLSGNFNPRSREGSDGAGELHRVAHLISIHAPARGATSQERQAQRTQGISIHAPARGATEIVVNVLLRNLISIHAPARGATRSWWYKSLPFAFQSTLPRGERPLSAGVPQPPRIYFNPRSREGSDQLFRGIIMTQTQFQSTLPRGERRNPRSM